MPYVPHEHLFHLLCMKRTGNLGTGVVHLVAMIKGMTSPLGPCLEYNYPFLRLSIHPSLFGAGSSRRLLYSLQ